MTAHHGRLDRAFEQYLKAAQTDSHGFGHRAHLHLAWLAICDRGPDAAVRIVCDGIRRTATYAGRPQKYHHTVSELWVRLLAYHRAEAPDETFEELLARVPALLNKRLVLTFYRSATLANADARQRWLPPDRQALPDIRKDRHGPG
jgi:hypothetical protein